MAVPPTVVPPFPTVRISDLPEGPQANSTDEFHVNQSGTSRRITVGQVVALVPSPSLPPLPPLPTSLPPSGPAGGDLSGSYPNPTIRQPPPPGIPEAPNDGKMYVRQNGQWVDIIPGVPEAPRDSTYYTRYNGEWRVIPISGDTDEYDLSAQLVPPPGPGQVRFNAALLNATKVWLHKTTAAGIDITTRLRSLTVDGSVLPDITMYIQDKDDHNRHYDYDLLGFTDLIDSSNYVELSIAFKVQGTTIISGGQRCIVVFR